MNGLGYAKDEITAIKNIQSEILKLKVACILDEFSYEWFSYECNLIQISPNNWKDTLIKEKPDLLFVQSAWHGYKGMWRRKINNLDVKKPSELKDLVDYCKQNSIPTVFWNIEDPYHFQAFIESAKLFEYIFTTDENSIPKYKKILGHDNVYVLPFAAQPKIHNPIGKDKEELGKIAFAGTWYKMGHEDRKKDMEIILKPALNYNLHIYDRMLNYNLNDSYKYPQIYRPYIKGSCIYGEMNLVYKKYPIFLNVNTVQDSPTMFSCRVFELIACGTNVISGYALGIEKMLPGIVKLCKTKEDTIKYLDMLINSKQIRERLSLLGQREVFNKHTYTQRFETILDKVGVKNKNSNISGVSIITCANGFRYINNVFDNFQRQGYEKKELIIILNNNNMNLEAWKEKAEGYDNVKVFQLDESKSLGEYLNYGTDKANFGYISKFSEDDYYAPEFIGDLMNAFKYTDADIVGKHTYYLYLEKSKTLAIISPNLENCYVKFLSISAMVIRKKVFNEVKFIDKSAGCYTDFFNRCIEKNIKLYSADRFNYVCIMNPSIDEQTWEIRDDKSSEKCKIIGRVDNYKELIIV